MGNRAKHSNKKERKSMSKRKKITLIVVAVLLLIIAGVIAAIALRYNYDKLDLSDLGINDSSLHSDKYRNIALFGVDSRANAFEGLSDSIMVITLDYEHKAIKLTSFMRDSLVQIEGHGYEKQTHAYSYGGAQLAVKTLNTNYDLDIQEYITINFLGLEKVINKVGGVTVTVGKNEVSEVNKYIKELNKINGGNEVQLLTGSGTQTLNGRQAVAYARIRKVGNGDAQRTERQREVVEQIMNKLFDLSHSDLVSLAYEFMPYVKTSFSINEIVDTATDYNTFKNATRSEFRYPAEYKGATVKGMSVVKPTTLESNVKELFKFIYEVEDYEVSSTVREISAAIEKQ